MAIKRHQTRALAREVLDDKFVRWRQLPARGEKPNGGWVRAIREALGMRAEDLADRMGVSQPSLTRLESNERTGRIRLDTLQRAADALECDLVYALVPRRSLTEMVTEKARDRAKEQEAGVAHTMALEDQAVSKEFLDRRVNVTAGALLTTSGLWASSAPTGRHR